jgi:hypothetical protein
MSITSGQVINSVLGFWHFPVSSSACQREILPAWPSARRCCDLPPAAKYFGYKRVAVFRVVLKSIDQIIFIL